MIFLIEFDRAAHRIFRFEHFDDAQREVAVKRRLALEIETATAKLDHEVVLLEAADEKQIRQTHGRYFKSVEDLVADFDEAEAK